MSHYESQVEAFWGGQASIHPRDEALQLPPSPKCPVCENMYLDLPHERAAGLCWGCREKRLREELTAKAYDHEYGGLAGGGV